MSNNGAMDVTTLIKQAGGVNALARRLGVSHPTICDWRRSGSIPAGRMFQVSHELDVPIETLAALIRQTPTAREHIDDGPTVLPAL
jgi:transcriptional regulator with XRE-family HTH domain